jgi:hypothetical protein
MAGARASQGGRSKRAVRGSPFTTPVAFNPGGLTCGANPGLPVIPDYDAPFCFTGTLHSVTIHISGELITDSESEMRAVMARQ